jgi:hypothetical protein
MDVECSAEILHSSLLNPWSPNGKSRESKRRTEFEGLDSAEEILDQLAKEAK